MFIRRENNLINLNLVENIKTSYTKCLDCYSILFFFGFNNESILEWNYDSEIIRNAHFERISNLVISGEDFVHKQDFTEGQ